MDEEQNLHDEISSQQQQRELYSKISRSILNLEVENTRNFKHNSEKDMVNKIVKLIEREIR